jgi:hypothetical protein
LLWPLAAKKKKLLLLHPLPWLHPHLLLHLLKLLLLLLLAPLLLLPVLLTLLRVLLMLPRALLTLPRVLLTLLLPPRSKFLPV